MFTNSWIPSTQTFLLSLPTLQHPLLARSDSCLRNPLSLPTVGVYASNIERTDAEAETPRLWPPHAKSWLTGKDPDAGRDWGQEEKGTTEDEMAGWYYQLDRHEFE